MLRQVVLGVLITATGASLGCTRRDAPYRFRSPLVSSVRASHVPPAHMASDASISSGAVTDRHGVHYRPARVDSDTLSGRLRSFVGKRDSMASSVEFAVSALAALGVTIDPELRSAGDGPALIGLAERRGAVATASARVLVGDLLAFDGVQRNKPYSLIAVVVASRRDGTVEFLYLWHRVIRRGFINRKHPGKTRDASGRVLNTFVRDFDSRGVRGLAGELLSAHVRLEHLAQSGFVR